MLLLTVIIHCKILADLMTMQEQFSEANERNLPISDPSQYQLFEGDCVCLKGKKIAWVGDGNNIVHSLMLAAPKFNCDMFVATPKGYEPNEDVYKDALSLSLENNTKMIVCNSPVEAVSDADIVVTDTWVSMGEEKEKEQRLNDFKGFQVNGKLLSYASDGAKFMHCLPKKAFEVTDDVFYSEKSVVFDEAENRLYTAMAVFLYTQGKL